MHVEEYYFSRDESRLDKKEGQRGAMGRRREGGRGIDRESGFRIRGRAGRGEALGDRERLFKSKRARAHFGVVGTGREFVASRKRVCAGDSFE